METTINNFSIISRLFGNLFYRTPTDPILTNVFTWLQQQGLSQIWALSTDKESETALLSLQMPIDPSLLASEYNKLFGGISTAQDGLIQTAISYYGIDLANFNQFRLTRGIPETENVDHFAHLLLTASWLEDNNGSTQAQKILFQEFLLPCASKFLTQVENQASLPFYRSLAYLTREILSAMSDELEETEVEE